jgi:tRNA-specific 2-thiouridylase
LSERITVGMSGGVDSAVAALLLKERGYDVTGVFMKNWDEQDETGVCTAESDWQDVRDCCDMIGIPYYAVNFTREYQERVFAHFLSEYRQGRTPNPDVLCNREIKFKAFLDFALKTGASRIATGHFARANEQGELFKGADDDKDQSYFLYMLKAAQLQKSLFPVGGLTKQDVRRIAREKGLPVCDKKDSTGVCFIGERHFKPFLKQFLTAGEGDIVTEDGAVVGRHDGVLFYTLGQRRGLGIGGQGDGRRWFVIGKDIKANRLIVAQGDDHAALYTGTAEAADITWVSGAPEAEAFDCKAKFRYRQTDQKVHVEVAGDRLHITADEPQRALTPGQSVVLYLGTRCLGGAILEEGAV